MSCPHSPLPGCIVCRHESDAIELANGNLGHFISKREPMPATKGTLEFVQAQLELAQKELKELRAKNTELNIETERLRGQLEKTRLKARKKGAKR